MLKKVVFSFVFSSFLLSAVAQQRAGSLHREIQWKSPVQIKAGDNETAWQLRFKNARYDATTGFLPFYSENISSVLNYYVSGITVKLVNARYEPLVESSLVLGNPFIKEEVEVKTGFGTAARQPVGTVSFIPLRKTKSGSYEKLISFDLHITQQTGSRSAHAGRRAGVSNSVLASGTWHKLAVKEEGIYKLDFAFLQKMGIDVAAVNPQQIRMYGNGGGMLPQANNIPRKDDLEEMAIVVIGEADGVFDAGDYILFYGQSPDAWHLDQADDRFHHNKHLYSDHAYYFITTDLSGTSKRINSQPSLASSPSDYPVTSFDHYDFHEVDQSNFIKSGRKFYGEAFDVNLTQSFSFSVPNLVSGSTAYYRTVVAAHSNTISNFTVKYNSQSLCNVSIPSVGTGYLAPYGKEAACSGTFSAAGSGLTFVFTYNQPLLSSIGYLDYIEFNVRRNLVMAENRVRFRDKNTAGVGVNAAYTIQGYSSNLVLWDVTDHNNVFEQEVIAGGQFVSGTAVVREYLLFSDQAYMVPVTSSLLVNQNLHSLPASDFIIVSHPLFLAEANRLAEFHRTNDNLTVTVADVNQVYNEFSSGARDISAIRDFFRLFYEKFPNNSPRYAMLFGDGSYDNKNDFSGNTNFIPTYQSENSLSVLDSYVSDDYFGLLDSNEGDWAVNPIQYLDVGIGRMPVSTAAEANQMVNKVIRYYETGNLGSPTACNETNSSLGDWRNFICLVADDEDGGTHLSQTENLLVNLNPFIKKFNYDKIYIDAFQQESTPGGQRFPDASRAIDNRIEKGTLVINYVGHGGELGWAHEKILGNEMVNAWKNAYRMSLFITATCEFSRFDDPARTSSGEYVLLNAGGGGIALFTTTRLVYSAPNAILNRDLFEHMFEPLNNEMPRLGDIFRLTKIDNAVGINPRNFTLLGDPALRLAYPKYDIVATHINNQPLSGVADTIKALSRVTISGEIRENGQKLSSFNGVIYPTVFDKSVQAKTLGQDQSSPVLTFNLQKNILYKGKASVMNGNFSFTFIIPKDISYNYGTGRLSFYAQNSEEDASGYYDSLIIGGIEPNSTSDVNGPGIKLYLNDEKFVFGGITNEDPKIFALLVDSSGINTVGNGIGHDITAQLDGQTNQPYVLNDFYEADLDNFQQGKILYSLKDLSEGRHSLQLKVWDIFNNSSQAYTEFIVASSAEIALSHVLNYPNPFTTHTSFFFEHNQACDGLDVQVQVFTVSGKLITTLQKQIFCDGYRSDQLSWNGTDDFGDRIGRGVYIYRLKVRNSLGQTAEKFEKLVLLR